MCLHTETFNPFEYSNIWSFVQGFILAYISLALFHISKASGEGLSFLIVAGTLSLIFTVFSTLNYSGFGPLFMLDHPIATLAIFCLVVSAGIYFTQKHFKNLDAEQA